MAQDRPQAGAGAQLRAQLLVAARRATMIAGAGAHAEVDRVVGRGVAGVQRDHHVDAPRRVPAHVALLEAQAGACRARRRRRCRDATRSARSSTPVDFGATAEASAQVVVHGEGQVALAGAEVDDADRRRAFAAQRRRRRARASNTSRNLSICLHLRAIAGTSRCCASVTPSSARNGRSSGRRRSRARSCGGEDAAIAVRRGAAGSTGRPSVRSMPAQRRLAFPCSRAAAVSPPAACSVACANAGRVVRPQRGARSRRCRRRRRGCGSRRASRGSRRTTAPARPSRRSAGRGRAAARRSADAASRARASRTRRRRCAARASARNAASGAAPAWRPGGRMPGWTCEATARSHCRRRQGDDNARFPPHCATAPCSESPTTRRSSSPSSSS